MKKAILLIVVSLFVIGATNAQKIKVESGNLKFLKEVAEVNIEMEYPEDMKYGKTTLKEYVDEKVTAKEKKKEGSGEAWKENFYSDRGNYNFQFVDAFGKYTGDLYVDENDPELEYTMNVKTTFMDPGFFIGIRSKQATIDLVVTFFKTDDPDNILATVKISKAPGAAAPDANLRMSDAYFTAARTFGKYLKKKYL